MAARRAPRDDDRSRDRHGGGGGAARDDTLCDRGHGHGDDHECPRARLDRRRDDGADDSHHDAVNDATVDDAHHGTVDHHDDHDGAADEQAPDGVERAVDPGQRDHPRGLPGLR
ncbi:MAG TPA: hypothetical protein VGU73_11225 [Acidimicrobiia bacterium]|nr:hypothetical protein [Acidimicrobiia bacterium]